MIAKMRRFAEAPGLRRLAVLVEAHFLGPQDDEAIKKQAPIDYCFRRITDDS